MKEVHGSGGTYLEKLGDTVTNAREDHLDVSRDRAGRQYVVVGPASLHEAVVAPVLHDVDWPKAFGHPAYSLGAGTRGVQSTKQFKIEASTYRDSTSV